MKKFEYMATIVDPTIKNRRLIVRSTSTRSCITAETHVSLEFILLVPKEQKFDGIVNFPNSVEKRPCDKLKFESKLPYKRSPINFSESAIYSFENDKQHYSELRLTEFGKFAAVELTICEECLGDYDYYTVLEDEYDGNGQHIYIAPKFTSEFKRLLQVDYSVDMHIKELINNAEQGNVRAMNALALVYFNGEGGEQNFEEAAKWWRMAAEKSIEIFKQNNK